jgi:hypothetical protein
MKAAQDQVCLVRDPDLVPVSDRAFEQVYRAAEGRTTMTAVLLGITPPAVSARAYRLGLRPRFQGVR